MKVALARVSSTTQNLDRQLIALKEYGCEKIFECGPGKTLTGLNRRIDRQLDAVALHNLEAIKKYASTDH